MQASVSLHDSHRRIIVVYGAPAMILGLPARTEVFRVSRDVTVAQRAVEQVCTLRVV